MEANILSDIHRDKFLYRRHSGSSEWRLAFLDDLRQRIYTSWSRPIPAKTRVRSLATKVFSTQPSFLPAILAVFWGKTTIVPEFEKKIQKKILYAW